MKRIFRDLKIKYKIFIPSSILIIILTLSIAVLTSRIQRETILDEARERSLGLCEILGYASVNSIIKNNLLELQGMVETIYRRSEVRDVVVVDTRGSVLVSAQIDNINEQWRYFSKVPRVQNIENYAPHFITDEESATITAVLPVVSLESIMGYAGVSLSLTPALQRISDTQNIILITGLVFLILSLGLLFLLSVQITRPIRDLTELAEEYGRGNLELKAAYHGADEAGELARAFNEMAFNIRSLEAELVHREKLAALGTTASAIAHELKTPLTSLINFINKLPEKKHDPAFLQMFQEITSLEIRRLTKLVDDLLLFSRKESLNKSVVSVETLFNDVLTMFRDRLQERGVLVKSNFLYKEHIEADHQKLFRVFVNLIDNAIEAVEDNGKVCITVYREPEKGKDVIIEVADTGKGMPAEVRERIFEPFFTTRSKGTGLGLAICKNIITLHHGSIDVESTENRGTKFIIQIPAN